MINDNYLIQPLKFYSKSLSSLVCVKNEAFMLFSLFCRLFGDSWKSVQQILKRHRWLWGYVLWTRLRHHARKTCFKVWVQVQVVLRSGVQRLWGRSRCSHLQTTQEAWLVGYNLVKSLGQKQVQWARELVLKISKKWDLDCKGFGVSCFDVSQYKDLEQDCKLENKPAEQFKTRLFMKNLIICY